jgi:hypothetical protein
MLQILCLPTGLTHGLGLRLKDLLRLTDQIFISLDVLVPFLSRKKKSLPLAMKRTIMI